jgi:hypothetical protein
MEKKFIGLISPIQCVCSAGSIDPPLADLPQKHIMISFNDLLILAVIRPFDNKKLPQIHQSYILGIFLHDLSA